MAIHRRLFLFLLILLPTQLGFHFWPAWAYLLGRKIDYLSPTIFLTDLVLIALLAAWWIQSAAKNRNHPVIRIPGRLVIIALAILGAVTVNVLHSANQEVALYKWMKILEFAGLGWYIVRTRPVIKEMIDALSVGILYSSGLAITQFILQHSAGGLFWFLGERAFALDTPGISRFNFCSPFISTCELLLRPYGTFPHPNVLGGFLATSLPFIIYALIMSFQTKQHTMHRYYYWVVLILGYIALALTLSRSAWSIGAAILIGIMGILLRSFSSRSHSGNVPFTVFLIVISFFVISLITMTGIFQPSLSDESVVRRITLSNVAISLWRQSPVVGIGLGNFLVALPQSTAGRQINFLQPVHNIYLLLLSETGLLGLCLFFAAIWIRVKNLIRHIHVQPFSSAHIFFLSLCGVLMAGFADHYPLTLQQGQLWIVVLFSFAFTSENR